MAVTTAARGNLLKFLSCQGTICRVICLFLPTLHGPPGKHFTTSAFDCQSRDGEPKEAKEWFCLREFKGDE